MATKKVVENTEIKETEVKVVETAEPTTKVVVTEKPKLLTKVKDGVKAIPNMTVKEFGKKVLLPVTVVGGAIGGVVCLVKKTGNSCDETDVEDYDEFEIETSDEVTDVE